jgi:hypothetical protein
MTRKLALAIFLALLGSPAWAQAPSAAAAIDITITSPPTPQPPPSGIPAPAVAAGFTTVAIDDDFSQPSWANTATWLDCNDGVTSPPSSPLYWRVWSGFGPSPAPCSSVLQATDPLTGLPALRMYWNSSFYNPAASMATNPLQNTNGGGTGRPIPPNAYIEITTRLVAASTTDVNWDVWAYAIGGAGYEWDTLETWVDNGDTSSCSTQFGTGWSNCVGPSPSNAGYPIAAYHRYGLRVTSDGSTAAWWCTYIDDNLIGCALTHPSLIPGNYKLNAITMIGEGCRGGAEPPGCGDGSNADVWISRIRMFSCAGVNSSAPCFSSTPNP